MSIDCASGGDREGWRLFLEEFKIYINKHPFVKQLLDPYVVIAAVGGAVLPANWAGAIANYPPQSNKPILPEPLNGQVYGRCFGTEKDAYYWIGWMQSQCAGLRFWIFNVVHPFYFE